MTIITLSESGLQTESWQWQLKTAVRDTQELAELLGLDLRQIASDFPLLIPRAFVSRMKQGDINDPLLKQVLINAFENQESAGYLIDPLNETGHQSTRGLIQKYQGRVLVVTTGQCAINCRYCFRRHFPYDEYQPNREDWRTLLKHIASDATISEVILSGGDPLILNDRYLVDLIDQINQIGHVTTIRLHTRLPVVIPARVCAEMLQWVQHSEKKIVLVTHINHANEIDQPVIHAMAQLKRAGVTLLNQSVLLRGVNDDANCLIKLSRALFDAGILPYYLHAMDPVAGAAHFDVAESAGHQLIKSMAASLPGYLVPRFVREVPGETSKQILNPLAETVNRE